MDRVSESVDDEAGKQNLSVNSNHQYAVDSLIGKHAFIFGDKLQQDRSLRPDMHELIPIY